MVAERKLTTCSEVAAEGLEDTVTTLPVFEAAAGATFQSAGLGELLMIIVVLTRLKGSCRP